MIEKTASPTSDTMTIETDDFSSSYDVATVINETITTVISSFTGNETLEEKGILMRKALEEALFGLGISRKARGLKTSTLKNNQLDAHMIASIIASSKTIILLTSNVDDSTANEHAALHYYNPEEGIYVKLTERDVVKMANEIQCGFQFRETKSVMAYLETMVPLRTKCEDENLIWLNNGIFDYANQTLMPFSSELVSDSKSYTNYNPNAKDIELQPGYFIHNIVEDLSNNADTIMDIYRTICAGIRNNKQWDKMIWFHGVKGRNGKSTVAALIRAIIGNGGVCEMSLQSYQEHFGLEAIIGKHLLITSDSNSHDFIKEPHNLKKITGGDYVEVHRKGQKTITYRPKVLLLMLMNDTPAFRASNPVARRIFPVMFEKSFEGRENTKIVEEYIYRDDVKEWIVKHVLTEIPAFYDLTLSKAGEDILKGIIEDNNAVLRFLTDGILEDIMGVTDNLAAEIINTTKQNSEVPTVQRKLSLETAYFIFKRWCERNGESNTERLSMQTFKSTLIEVLDNSYRYKIRDIPLEVVDDSTRPRIYSSFDTSRMASAIIDYLSGSKKYDDYIDSVIYYGPGSLKSMKGSIQSRCYLQVKCTQVEDDSAQKE